MAALHKRANHEHEVVVITGATAGVGRAVARRFAREGAWLGLVARDETRLEETKQEIESLGGKAVVLAGDVANPETHEQIAELTEQTFGAIDIWINNAMSSVNSLVWEMPPDEFQRVTEVTFLGAVYGTKAALRRMRPRNRGTIVQVGSTLAYRSTPFQSAYCAAKHALRGFTDSLRAELKQDEKDIRLTMVQLPSVNTPQSVWVKSGPAIAVKSPNPTYQPEVAADAIFWAAHHRRREVYVGYQTAVGIKLNKLVPAFLDGFLAQRSFAATQQLRNPSQPNSPWQPVRAKFAVRGPFDADSQSRSLQLTVSKHRSAWLWALIGMASAVTMAWKRKATHRSPTWAGRT